MEIYIMGHEQVGPAVIVVVAKRSSRGPARIARQARGLRGIAECAVAIVPVKYDSIQAGHEQIGPAVVVVVADYGAHGPAWVAHSGFVSNIGKRAVVIVME